MFKFIKSTFMQLRIGISRFISAFILCVFTFISIVFYIFAYESINNYNVILTIIFSLVLSVFISVAFKLITEKINFKSKYINLLNILSILISIPVYLILYITDFTKNNYSLLSYFGVLLSFVALCIFLVISDKNKSTIIGYLIKNFVFYGFIATVFMGGLILCITAFYYLIWQFDDLYKYILTIVSFSYIVLFFNLFLSQVPMNGEKNENQKSLRIIVLYAAFPVYLLLLLVLYIYLGKILITFDMPGGQINIFASLAILFFIFFYLTITQYDDIKIINYWKKYGGYLLFPVIIAQSIAVYIRISAYGLTEARWASILATFIGIIFIILTLIKEGKYIKLSIASIIIITLISTLTPLNILDIPVYQQIYRLENILEKNNMFENKKIIPKSDLAQEDKADITNIYNYLCTKDKRPDYINDNKFIDIFGFEAYYNTGENHNYSDFYSGNTVYNSVDLSGYNKYFYIYENNYINNGKSFDKIIITIDNEEYDITSYIENFSLLKETPSDLSFFINDNIKVFITNYNVEKIYANNGYGYYVIEGFALIK